MSPSSRFVSLRTWSQEEYKSPARPRRAPDRRKRRWFHRRVLAAVLELHRRDSASVRRQRAQRRVLARWRASRTKWGDLLSQHRPPPRRRRRALVRPPLGAPRSRAPNPAKPPRSRPAAWRRSGRAASDAASRTCARPRRATARGADGDAYPPPPKLRRRSSLQVDRRAAAGKRRMALRRSADRRFGGDGGVFFASRREPGRRLREGFQTRVIIRFPVQKRVHTVYVLVVRPSPRRARIIVKVFRFRIIVPLVPSEARAFLSFFVSFLRASPRARRRLAAPRRDRAPLLRREARRTARLPR